MTIHIASHLGALHQVHIVAANQEANIVNERNSRGEQLDRARQQVPVVVAPQRRVVCAVDLNNTDSVTDAVCSWAARVGRVCVRLIQAAKQS